jgi:L-alanine-DL-glutamate epimerase-like enolase superfamily enzyme
MMTIDRISAIGLGGQTPEGGWSAEIAADDCVHTLVRIDTHEGIVGWGSVFTNVELVRSSLSILEPLYELENALEPDRLCEKLHQHTFWLGRGGAVTHTISGINIALWDILGKATGQPVGRLLGGRYRDRVMPYASILMDEPAKLIDHLDQVMEQGFRAVKIGWGPFGRVNEELDDAIVRAARDTVGEDCKLMVDAGGSDAFWSNGLKWASRTAEMLGDYGVYWFEEALEPDAIEAYARLRDNSPVPIAAGEVLTRRKSFSPWLRAGALDIVQPDVTKVGGLSEARRIGWMAEEHGATLIPHGWNTAVGLAADLHLASALPGTDLVEYITGSPYVDELTTSAWKLDAEGMLAIPDAPGLGVEISDNALDRFGR